MSTTENPPEGEGGEQPPEATQLPAEVEDAELEVTHPIVLPEEPPVDPGTPVEGPVNPDHEVENPDAPYPDNSLPSIPEGETGEEAPSEPEEVPEPVELNAAATVANIVAAARKRCERYTKVEQERGRRGPASQTFACVLAGAADKYPNAEQVLAAIQSAAEEWLGSYRGGDISRRHTLAQRIVDGRYNVSA